MSDIVVILAGIVFSDLPLSQGNSALVEIVTRPMDVVATTLGGLLHRVKVPATAIEQKRVYARANLLCDTVAAAGFVVAVAMACYLWWPTIY